MLTPTSICEVQATPAGLRDLGELDDAELLNRLRSDTDRLPRDAFDEVVRRIERLGPALEAIVRDDALWESKGDDWWACVHATFALSAGGRLADLALLIEAIRKAARLGVDWLTDPAGELFFPFGTDCWQPLEAVVEDGAEDSYTRILCLSALISCAVVQDQARRPGVLALATNVACLEDADWDLRDFAVEMLTEFAADGHAKEVEAVLDLSAPELKDAVHARARHCTQPLSWCRRDPLVFYAPEAITRRQDRWERAARLVRESPRPAPEQSPEAPPPVVAAASSSVRPATQTKVPFVREAPKVGRNDPCPCGSGRKLKKCCKVAQRTGLASAR